MGESKKNSIIQIRFAKIAFHRITKYLKTLLKKKKKCSDVEKSKSFRFESIAGR